MPQLLSRTGLSTLAVAIGLTGSLAALPGAADAKPRAATTLGDRALRVGASGPDVRELQKLLRQVGFEVKKVDGEFGPGTKKAVQAFQTARNLQASGTVGKLTVAALREAAMGGSTENLQTGGVDPASAGAKSKSLGDRIPVRKGMSGHDVKVLQDFLGRAGQKVTVDGEYGPGTVTAVKAFETANNLAVDGLIDANDIAVLRGQAAAGPNARAAAIPAALAPGDQAQVGPDGMAIAPANAPEPVKQIIAAGNKIAKTKYIYGGGHGKWDDAGYDCSGSVSYTLYKAGLLEQSMASGGYMGAWPKSQSGLGKWVTIYANEGHMYMIVAGIRYDTSAYKAEGSRWSATVRPTKGYVVSHPVGL